MPRSALQTAVLGRPSIISEQLVEKILANLANGNYVRPSVEAAGIHYSTFKAWVVRGEQDKDAGRDTPYSMLVARLAHAQAAAEASLVDGLRKAEDWRAQAFILERRHRSRWGKDETQRAPQVIVQIPDSLANVLADAMRVGSRHLEPVQVIDSTSEPAEPSPDSSSKDG